MTTDTTNEIHKFAFGGLELRVITINGEPWFVAADALRALGSYVRTNGKVEASMACSILSDDEHQTNRIWTEKGIRIVLVVSESGLYKLIMRSDKPEARQFQDWVTREVLPSIRKTGGVSPTTKERNIMRVYRIEHQSGLGPLEAGLVHIHYHTALDAIWRGVEQPAPRGGAYQRPCRR